MINVKVKDAAGCLELVWSLSYLGIHESWLVTSQFHFPPSMSKVMNDTYFSLNVRKSLLGLSSMFILQLPFAFTTQEKVQASRVLCFLFSL